MKIEERIKDRIRNQLRIHWCHLKNHDDYNKVADFMDFTIQQLVNRIKKDEATK